MPNASTTKVTPHSPSHSSDQLSDRTRQYDVALVHNAGEGCRVAAIHHSPNPFQHDLHDDNPTSDYFQTDPTPPTSATPTPQPTDPRKTADCGQCKVCEVVTSLQTKAQRLTHRSHGYYMIERARGAIHRRRRMGLRVTAEAAAGHDKVHKGVHTGAWERTDDDNWGGICLPTNRKGGA